MTEKQYVRIVDHLEKEVQIFDTINEKKIFNIFFNELDSAICLNGALTDVVDLLNELSEENKALRKQLQTEHIMLDNAILLERTRMGQSALKQYKEAIQ